MKSLAVVSVSGGLDSCVTTAIAAQENDLALLHINYGQKTEARELKAFHNIADFYKVEKRLVIDLPHFRKIGGSSLTDNQIEIAKADLQRKEIPTSYVPFRNAHILTACVSWAEVIGADRVYIGAVEEDSAGYPDCREDFFKAFEKAAQIGTKPDTLITIETPIINLTKDEIVKKGLELKAPLHLTWSCYQNEEKACGTCDSCAYRLRGFQKAGIEDPLEYIEKPNYIGNK